MLAGTSPLSIDLSPPAHHDFFFYDVFSADPAIPFLPELHPDKIDGPRFAPTPESPSEMIDFVRNRAGIFCKSNSSLIPQQSLLFASRETC